MRNTTPRACAAATWPSRVHIRRHASGAPDREYAQSRARSRARAHPLLGDSRIPTPRWGTRGNQVRSLAEQVACAAPRVGKPQPMRLPDARRGAGEPQEPVAKRPASRPARALLPRHLPELARFATAKCGWAVMRRPRDRVPAALRPPTRPKPPSAPRSAAGARRRVLTIAGYHSGNESTEPEPTKLVGQVPLLKELSPNFWLWPAQNLFSEF